MKTFLSLAILLELNNHEEPIKASIVAEKFEISTRSIYRYLSELESAAVIISLVVVFPTLPVTPTTFLS